MLVRQLVGVVFAVSSHSRAQPNVIMPGLLQADAEGTSRKLAAIGAEFLATLFFSLMGGLGGAAANGLLLAVLVFVTANVSGGHINPAVTVASMATGHTSISRGLAYIVAQVLGATTGSALQLLLVPNAGKVGCFAPAAGATMGQAFGWEVAGTFLLVVAVYAVAVGEPSFGIVAPLGVGAALFAAATTGGAYSGAAFNPARVLGPAVVFTCWRGSLWYVLAELLGGLAAAIASWPLYGTGVHLGSWLDRAGDAVYERLEGAVRNV